MIPAREPTLVSDDFAGNADDKEAAELKQLLLSAAFALLLCSCTGSDTRPGAEAFKAEMDAELQVSMGSIDAVENRDDFTENAPAEDYLANLK